MTDDQKDAFAQSLADLAEVVAGEDAASILYQAMILSLGEELPPDRVAQVVLDTAEDAYAMIMANIRDGEGQR